MDIKKVIRRNDFRFNKRFGQNFIEDGALLNKIADFAEVKKTDCVLEIGVGAGTLTKVLAERAKKVVGYEIDKNLRPILSETLSGVENAEVVFKDFMKEGVSEINACFGEDFIVVANLPYYITSPITMRLLEEFPLCKRIVIMVQKEVALRFTANCGTKDYGAITASIDYYGDATYGFTVDRTNFYPAPNVDSAVVRIDRNSKYLVKSEDAFKKTLAVAFSARRKTLVNNMMANLKLSRGDCEDVLKSLSLNLNVRGEELSAERFVALSNILYDKQILR